MKLQTKATQVAQRTQHLLQAAASSRGAHIPEPVWFRVVGQHPPTHQLTQKVVNLQQWQKKAKPLAKNPKTGLYVTRHKQKFASSAQHLYRARPLRFFEDKIRSLFYTQHPWELARPKLLVENDGDDAQWQDWSSIDQPNKKLDGESVVQRTLYLLKHEAETYPQTNWVAAYDQARNEFYRLRMREEVQLKVAAEEARMFGAVFGQSYIDFGVEQEQAVIDEWMVEATEASKAKRANVSTPVSDEDGADVPNEKGGDSASQQE